MRPGRSISGAVAALAGKPFRLRVRRAAPRVGATPASRVGELARLRLERHSRGAGDESESERIARAGANDAGAAHVLDRAAPEDGRQRDRKGQAQSPVEDTLDQPPKHKEGHR